MRVYPNIPGFNNLGFNNTDNGIGYDNYLSLDLNFAAQRALDPRITFVRLSGATQIGSTGLVEYAPENIIRNSENLTVWNSLNSATVLSGILAPDNTNTAFRVSFTNNTNSCIYTPTDTSPVIGRVATLSFWAWSNTNKKFRFDIFTSSNQLVSADITTTSIPTRYSFTSVVPANSTIVYGGILNASTADSGDIFVWRPQLERHPTARSYNPTTTSVYYGARFTHNPVTLASLGLLIEESRVNLFLSSEDLSVSPWGTQTTNVTTASVTNPAGDSTASLLTPVAGSPACHVRQQITAAASVYVCSFWIRSGSATTASFLFRDETAGSSLNCTPRVVSGPASVSGGSATAQITGLSSAWSRVSFTLVSAATPGNTLRAYIYPQGTGVSTGESVYVWGCQLEAGAFATSYIPTTSATVTRAADVVTMTGTNFSTWYNQSEWTAVMDYQMNRIVGSAEFPRLFTFQDSAFNSFSRIYLGRVSDATSNAYAQINVSGTNYGKGVAGLGSNTANVRAGASFSASLLRLAQNNVAADNTTVAVPTVDRLYLGSNSLGTNLNGTIARFRFYRRAMPSNIQTLTA